MTSSSSSSEPCSHAEAWAAARGGPDQAYLPLQRCLVEEWREARARAGSSSASSSVEVSERRKRLMAAERRSTRRKNARPHLFRYPQTRPWISSLDFVFAPRPDSGRVLCSLGSRRV